MVYISEEGYSNGIGSIVGYCYKSDSVRNCYYLDTLSRDSTSTSKTEKEFVSGEVAWLLQAGRKDLVWGQTIGTDTAPVLTSDVAKKVYKVTFIAEGTPDITLYMNQTIATEIVPEPPTNYHFAGWATENSPNAPRITTVDQDTTVYAIFEADLVQGKVTKDGKPVSGATVTLKQGDEVVDTTTTDAEGKYTFPEAKVGAYDVVVEYNGQTMTSMVDVVKPEDGETVKSQDLDLPAQNVSSTLETGKADGIVHAVGGLDDLAKEQTIAPDETVTVTMTIQKADETTAKYADEIEAEAEGRELDFF